MVVPTAMVRPAQKQLQAWAEQSWEWALSVAPLKVVHSRLVVLLSARRLVVPPEALRTRQTSK